MASFENSKVLFLQGDQAKLNSLIANGGAKEGAFYLTNDTHRLYIGRTVDVNTVKPIAVNEGIVTVANIKALESVSANPGEFYFATQENILCIYNGKNFIQINSDTNTTNTMLQSSVGAENEVITFTLTDSDKDSVSTSLRIIDSTGAAQITHDVEAIKTEGTVTFYGSVIDIKSDIYTIDHDSVTVSKGSGDAAVSYAGQKITLTSAHETEDAGGDINLVAGNNVTINKETGFGTDGKEKAIVISSTDTNTVITKVEATALTGSDLGKLKITITDTDTPQGISGTTGVLGYANGKSGAEAGVYALGSEFPAYTKAEVDGLFRGLNGMTYKTTATAVPTAASNGDMWMASASFDIVAAKSVTNADVKVNAGDLIIAQGTEDPNTGLIGSDLKFAVIPSGDDTEIDTTYKWTPDTSNNALYTHIDETKGELVGGVQLKAGTSIDVTSETDEDGVVLITTIDHADLHATDDDLKNAQTTGEEKINQATVKAVTAVEINKQGHVVKVETTDIGVKDTTYELHPVTTSTKVANQSVLVKESLYNKLDKESSDAEFLVKSDTLKVNAVAATTDTPAGFSIDLTWGTF